MKQWVVAIWLAGGCACAASAQTADAGAGDVGRDRAAILAMQGEYEVDFAFDETVLLASGYERAPAMRSGGEEAVIVVEDQPQRIVLQHILVDRKSGHVTKHWRQDWVYQAARRWEFVSDQVWRVRELPADETRGAWTQCVYEVSDAPRYCGTGRWRHEHGVSVWTSDLGWRPLPRREHTRRDDYNALQIRNRHTVVPGGWTHEQDNLKVVRSGQGAVLRAIAREFGFNDYRLTGEVDFEPAYRYWRATRDYWARVRARWDAYLSASPGLRLKAAPDGMDMILPLFAQAAELEAGREVDDARIDAIFARWVERAPPEPAALP